MLVRFLAETWGGLKPDGERWHLSHARSHDKEGELVLLNRIALAIDLRGAEHRTILDLHEQRSGDGRELEHRCAGKCGRRQQFDPDYYALAHQHRFRLGKARP